MVYFPERRSDGTWVAEKIFTKRIPHTVEFHIDGLEFDLYRDVTRFVKQQSTKAASQSDDPPARAVGFLMSLYQRRLASSTYAMRHSLENRARRLEESLKRAHLPAAARGSAAQARDHSNKRLLLFEDPKCSAGNLRGTLAGMC